MKKGFKLIVPSFLAIIVCVLLLAGSTFALFTSDVTTNVSVNSATVNVEASLAITQLYSVVPTDNETGTAGSATAFGVTSQYDYELQNNGTFKTKGTATILQNGTLKLENMVPGDRVDFKLNVTNHSNVDIKYRLSVNASGDAPLLAANELTIAGVKHTGLSTYKSAWTFAAASSTIFTNGLDFSLVLPVATGNTVQKKSAAYNVVLEAVQANAKTEGNEVVTLVSYNTDGDLTLNKIIDNTVQDLASAYVPKAAMDEDTTSLDLSVVKKDSPIANTLVSALEEQIPFDVTFTDQDGDQVHEFAENVTINLQLEAGLMDVKVFHYNSTSSKYEEISGVVYNSTTGVATFSHNKFSEYSVTYKKAEVIINNETYQYNEQSKTYTNTTDEKEYKITENSDNELIAKTLNTGYGFYDSYVENNTWVHEVTTKAQFRNILAHITATNADTPAQIYVDGKIENAHLADANTEYRIINDIDFEGSVWTALEMPNLPTFTGKLIGNNGTTNNVVLSNVDLIPAKNVIRSDWSSAGLFRLALNASFENITLEDFSIGEGKGCGFFVAGNNPALPYATLSFKNCVVEDSCVMNVEANSGAFIGSSRGIAEVSFDSCVNNANVIGTAKNMGGFIGTATTLSNASTNTLTFKDCTNNGNVMGLDYVGGFTGNTGNDSRILTGTGNQSNGNVYVTSSGTNYGFFFSGDSWYKASDSSFSGTINCRLKVSATSGGFEKANMGNFPYTIKHNDTTITSENYTSYIDSFTLGDLSLSFDENNKLVINNNIDCDKVVVNIRQHALRISNEYYWIYQASVVEVTDDNFEEYKNAGNLYIRTGEPFEGAYYHANQFTLVGANDTFDSNATYVNNEALTNEMGGALQSETEAYMAKLVFNSIAAVDVTKVTQCGYFIPTGANNPQASYNAVFDTYKLNPSLAGTEGYENGYHVANGVAYIVVENNVSGADQYLAICEWRNDIVYEVTAYKDGAIVANGTIEWGRGSGDATYLEAINLG